MRRQGLDPPAVRRRVFRLFFAALRSITENRGGDGGHGRYRRRAPLRARQTRRATRIPRFVVRRRGGAAWFVAPARANRRASRVGDASRRRAGSLGETTTCNGGARGENGRERRAFAASATRGGRFAYVRDWRPCCAECCCAARWERRRGGRGGERGVGADDRDRCDARERFSWWKNRERRSMEGCPYVDDAFQTTPQISRDRVQEGAARRRRVANRWRQSCRGQRTPRRIQKRTRTRT